MKTKLFFSIFLIGTMLIFAQKKEVASKENQKFYFPAVSFSNTKDFDKNFNMLLTKISPLEINEQKQEYSFDAEIIYLLEKNYKGLENYSKTEKFPKENLPLKSFAEAMIADPTQGNMFTKTFSKNFSEQFNKLDEQTKTAIASGYFDQKMLGEYQKMAEDFKNQLSKNKTDSISYKDAKKLINFEALKMVTNTIMPLGKELVKNYVLNYFQPFITGNMFMSVVQPANVNDVPDANTTYKLLFELTDFSRKSDKETAFQTENGSLIEAGRILNLHVGSGISPEKLKIVFIVHASATDILLNNENYKAKFKVGNSNLPLIKQMQSKGAKFLVCGQSMSWDGLKLKDLIENVQEAFSAKTALSNYQTQGYILYKFLENN